MVWAAVGPRVSHARADTGTQFQQNHMAKAKAAQTEEAGAVTSQDILGEFLNEHKNEHFAFIQPKHTRISTGSLILDSLVAVRSGGVVRLVGKGAELGKSSEAFVLADNFMKTMPKAKVLYIKAEARLTPEIIARSGLKWVFTSAEWVEGTVFCYPCNVFENMAELLEKVLPQMYEAGEHLGVIIDSLDGLMLRADRTKDLWSTKAESPKVAGVPLLTKLLFRRLGLPITHYDVLMMVTGQFSADIKLDPYSAGVPRQADSAGGNAIAHQSDYVFEYLPRYQGDMILEDPTQKPDYQKNKTVGVYATLTIKKSGTDVTGTRVRIPIKKGRVGNAIWVEREIVEMMLGWELITKAGSWLSIDAKVRAEIEEATGVKLPEKVQGLDKCYTMLETEPKATQFLFDKFCSLISAQGV
jgi:hypothetical protein